MAVAQQRSPARTVTVGDFFVDMTSLLDAGLAPHAYYGKDRQSNDEANACLSSTHFQQLAWDAWGTFLLCFIVQVASLPWWSTVMCRQERSLVSLFAYHVLLGLRMLAAGRSPKDWLHQATYSALLKSVAHMILRCYSWPDEFGVLNPRTHMERYAEHAFSRIRKINATHTQGVRDFEYAQAACQMQAPAMSGPAAGKASQSCSAASLKEDALRAEALAIPLAMRFLCMCCPNRFANINQDALETMKSQVEAWYSAEGHLAEEEHEESDGSDGEDGLDGIGSGLPSEHDQETSAEDGLQLAKYLANRESVESKLLAGGGCWDLEADSLQPSGQQSCPDGEVAMEQAVQTGAPSGPHPLIDLFGGKHRSFKEILPGMLRYMEATEASKGTKKPTKRKQVWNNKLAKELAALRTALEHDKGTRTSRMAGWARTAAVHTGRVRALAGLPPEGTEGTWVPEEFRPRSVAWLAKPASPAPPQVLLMGCKVVLVLAVFRAPVSKDGARKEKATRLTIESLPSKFVKQLRVCHLSSCEEENHLLTSPCHKAEVVSRMTICSELQVDSAWEDAGAWPPLFHVKLSPAAWQAWRAARQMQDEEAEKASGNAEGNSEATAAGQASTEASPSVMVPSGKAKAKAKAKGKAASKATAKVKSMTARTPTSWSNIDKFFFMSRGWTAPGKQKLEQGLKLMLDAYLQHSGAPYLVDGRVPKEAGGADFQAVLAKAPGFFETTYGGDITGALPAKVFSLGVYGRLGAVHNALAKSDRRPLDRLIREIMKHG